MMENKPRGPWFIFTGLLLGFVMGLAYAWVLQPKEPIATSPATLKSTLKDDYRYEIAAAFAASGDLVRAKARLSLLGDASPVQTILRQADGLAKTNKLDEERVLRLLATALLRENSNFSP